MTCCFSVLSSSTKVFLLIGRALANKKTQNPKDNYQETAFKHFSQLKIYREARTSNLSEPCLIHTVRFQVSKSILIILSSDSKYESGMTCRQSCLITHLWKALSRPHPPAHSKMPLRSMISGLSYIFPTSMAQIVARQEPLMTKTNVLSKPRGGIKSWLSLQIRRTFSSRLLRGTLDTAQVAGVTWSTTYNLKSPRKQTMMLIWIPGYTTICQFMKELVHHFRDVLFVKLQCKEPSGS